MNDLSFSSMTLSRHLVRDCSQQFISRTLIQSSMDRHLCPCCSTVLLRHIRSEGIYWRCSYCYQKMPI